MLKILEKKYHNIRINSNIPGEENDKKYSVWGISSDNMSDFMAELGLGGVIRADWIDSTDEIKDGYKAIAFKKFKDII